jgi:exopolyphosphatase/guanosine-5'-triphosphate,3'-diphosphate pyrophosphatase
VSQRWEWRTFAGIQAQADPAFEALESTAVTESDELYLLAADDVSVKVRDDLMDMKVLRAVDAAGLERWEPVLKVGFPMPAGDVARILAAVRVDARPTRDAYALEEFLDEFIRAGDAVRAVTVHKRRVRYTVGGCMAERTDIVADGRTARTTAREAEDPSAVVAAVASVGLDTLVNTSYPRGLRALLDGREPRYAVLDVGTNSIKFHLAERDTAGAWRVVADRAEVTRLGEAMEQTGEISPADLERAITAIAGMVEEARAKGALAITAVGTAGHRAAGNQATVLDTIRERTGIRVQVISGEEEARLAYLAAVVVDDRPLGRVVVFDTGGGSSQFTFGHGAQVDERFSLPIGAVRVTERFGLDGAVSGSVLTEARSSIAADLARLDGRSAPDELIAMGGAVTNLAAVKHALATYDPDVVDRTVLDRTEIDRQIELYASMDAEARRDIVGLQPARAEVILAGACIVRTVLDKLDRPALTVCDRGLRHGLLAETFGGNR